jgi:hypothetical protein
MKISFDPNAQIMNKQVCQGKSDLRIRTESTIFSEDKEGKSLYAMKLPGLIVSNNTIHQEEKAEPLLTSLLMSSGLFLSSSL